MTCGRVYLVGAGPGDPGLLTLKAVRVLGAADVVVYDHLVADAILDRLPASVERVCAGKETGSHVMNQEAINELLDGRARRGQTVVRLKGGDPFVFGRGGEEAEYLAARGIPFEVVPGVTSAVGVPAYAGIPVTHRGVAASLAIVTGRAGPIGEAPDVKWEQIAGADTIVVLMGVANQESLVRTLMDAGRSPDTPVAAIRWGTTAQQRVVVGTLATIGTRMQEAGLRPPAILVVGDVVSLLDRMRWAEHRPLFGCRVLVPAAYPSPLTEPLENLGAEVLHVAPVEVRPPTSWEGLDGALRNLASLTGLVFTDEVGVVAVFERLAAVGLDARALAGCQLVAADGETAMALAKYAVRAERVLDGAELARLGDSANRGAWLVIGGADAQGLVASMPGRRGATCLMPPVCTETTPKWRADRLRELLTTRRVTAIAFLRAAEVQQLLRVLDPDERQSLHGVTLAASPVPAEALRRHGFEPSIVAADGSARALAARLAAALPHDRS